MLWWAGAGRPGLLAAAVPRGHPKVRSTKSRSSSQANRGESAFLFANPHTHIHIHSIVVYRKHHTMVEHHAFHAACYLRTPILADHVPFGIFSLFGNVCDDVCRCCILLSLLSAQSSCISLCVGVHLTDEPIQAILSGTLRLTDTATLLPELMNEMGQCFCIGLCLVFCLVICVPVLPK